MKHPKLLMIILVMISCQPSNDGDIGSHSGVITEKEFQGLMKNVADGWSAQNTDLALSSFDEDAIYMEPPSTQYFRGHEQLRPYFDELTDAHKMEFHHLWFNTNAQTGSGEFTFSYGGDTSTVGVVVVELENGKIKFWREYLRTGPTEFEDFLRIENKEWKWHIGNYPVPKDSINRK